MKHVMKQYFKKLTGKWEEFNGTLPLISWNEEADANIYVGSQDEEGYIAWKHLEKCENTNFQQFEQEINVILHNDVKAYFNSFWFLEMIEWVSQYNINLYPVIPGVEPEAFCQRVKEYILEKENSTYIPLGFESNGMLVVMNNESGEIFVENGEEKSYKYLSSSLKELISQLDFK
ncbi:MULTISPECIES: SecY-interacting protein Syd [Priestia]|uniref:SecY-interacting protein Syd n=1 Tax=Priestia TaxID=2800373 RepID=UPI00112D0FDB|nr:MULTISPECIES: SecY-interacting protein Syd [Priestia]